MNTGTQNLADKHTLADESPSESRIDALSMTTPNLAENLLWLMDPPVNQE